MARILIVEEMKGIRKSIAGALSKAGFDIVEAESSAAGVEILKRHKFDLIIVSVILTEREGTEVMSYVASMEEKPLVIAMSGGNDQVPADMAHLLTKPQAQAVLKKPINENELIEAIKKLLG